MAAPAAPASLSSPNPRPRAAPALTPPRRIHPKYSLRPSIWWRSGTPMLLHALSRLRCRRLSRRRAALQQHQQLSLLSQASWGRLEMKPTENKNKKHKKGTRQRKS
ncbi:hypothetical protein PAHAL_5G062500 [Panicum hallii]|uniref:Uncharacterized protein n=1 Tax=Panicum hallii TaxID=206008 RepID=A0A2T8IJ59_9POAL|nr:hypothetical protein PAHAL_5G062500 [Panicum hallii]